MKKGFFFLLLCPLLLEAVTIHITNDSRYPLIATIYDKHGDIMSVAGIPKGQKYTWRDSVHGATNMEEGPFRIVFTCRNGDEYGYVRHVADNVTVNARSAQGRRHCGS